MKPTISYTTAMLADLLEDPANARSHDEANLEAIRGSLREFGQVEPLVVQKSTRKVIGGNGRMKVMRALGWTEVDIAEIDCDDAAAAVLGIALNRTAELAGWNQISLDALLNSVETDDADLQAMLDAMMPKIDEEKGAVEDLPESYVVYLPCESEAEQKAIIVDLLANNLNPRALTVPKISKEKVEPEPMVLQTGDRRIVRECGIQRTARVVQVEGIFDLSPAEKAKREWIVNLTLDKPWAVGLIVGPSGSGKSTIARELFGDKLVNGWPWPEGKALVDGFPEAMAASAITGLLSSVGLSSPPSWVKPFHVLSNGEQFRANLARSLAEQTDLAVVDEFTSVVDRTVAKVGSAAVAKCVRNTGRRFVAVTCHYDVEEWLQPDWKYDVAEGKLTWRLLRRRPEIQLQIRPSSKSEWPLFGLHHYLNSAVHKGARCFVGEVAGRPAAFVAVLHSPGRTSFWREHRCVCLPDFQGVGIGNAMSEFVASLYLATGKGYGSITSHPSMIAHRMRSPLWKTTRAPSMGGAPNSSMTSLDASQAIDRLTASFKFIGPARPEQAKAFGII